MNMKTALFSVLVTLQMPTSPYAQTTQDLQNEILAMDKLLFEAFNSCDIKVMSKVLDQDLEFYHDKGGLTNHSQTMRATKNNCNDKLGLIRTLLPEFTSIFPVSEYGAIQEGRHQFCHLENGKNECGTFKFVHIWKLAKDKWTITRVISYDH